MKTAIVILNWNGKEFLKRFLPGLLISAGQDNEVIVADNASNDGSMEMMEAEFPHVKTMVFQKNWGYTGGYNRALFQIEADYYLLINSDIDVPADWIGPLAEWMDTHPECGICAPKLHDYENRERFEYAGAAGGFIDRFGYPFCRGRILRKTEYDKGQYDTPSQVLWVSGACLMIRSGLFRELGGFDERFFAHMEEIDLCWRAQLLGSKVYALPFSTIYHIGGGTLPNDSPYKLYLNYRNNLLMLGNNLPKTIALELYRKGVDADEAADTGMKDARKRVHRRMVMDGISAVIYLATFRFAYFRSVVRAHRDFRKLHIRKATVPQIADFLRENGDKIQLKGIYPGWIIPEALFCRKKIFRTIREFSAKG